MNRACRSLEATSARSAKGRHARVSCAHTKTALGSNGRSAPLKAGSASSGPFFLPPALPPADPGAMPVRRSPAPGGLAPGAAPLAGGAAAAPGLAALAAGLTPAPVALLSVWLPPPCQPQGSRRSAGGLHFWGERRWRRQAPSLLWWQSSELRGPDACGGGQGSSPASS